MLVTLKTFTNHFSKIKTKQLLKQSKIITQQPKTPENANIIDINYVTPKLSKAIRQAKYISCGAGKSSISLLYIKTTKAEKNFGEKKIIKMQK